MNSTIREHGILGTFAAVIGYLYNCLSEMVVVLIFLILMDYILGIVVTYIKGKQFDKEKAIKGALKKVLYSFVLALAFLGDYIILYFSSSAGITLPVNGAVGIAVIAYLLGTEGFSCTKHCLELGLPAPEFLLKFFGLLKDQSGNIVEIKEGEQ